MRILPRPTLNESRERFLDSIAKLDRRYKSLRRPDAYPVTMTAALNATMISEKLRVGKRQD